MGEVEIHDEPVPLTGLGEMIERTEKARAVQERGPGTGRDRRQDRGQPQAPDRRVRNHRGKNLRRVFQAAGQSEARGGNPVRRRAGARRQDHRQGRRSHQAAVLPASRLRRQLLYELGHRLHDRSGDRTAERRLPPAEPAQPLRDRHQRHRAVRSQAHLHGRRGARRKAADHVHGRHPSARFRRRDHAPSRRRAVAGRDAPRRAGGGRQKPHQRHPGAGRRRDDARGLSRRARLCRAGRAVRRIHGLLRRDPHGPGVSLHRDHHAQDVLHHTLAARLGVRARPDRQPEHQRDPHRSRGDANPARPRGAIRSRSIRGTRRAARTRCASRSGSAASAKRGSPSRRCSAASRGSSTSSSSTRTSTSATTCRSNGRSERASRPTRTS